MRLKRLNQISFLAFLLLNLVGVILLNLDVISYGPDMQDPFMSLVMITSIVIGGVLFFAFRVQSDEKFRFTNYLILLGYLLEILYLIFES